MLMKLKILSPAGEMESLSQAVYNGADEVYLGIKDYNARNIEGFSMETLKRAVDFAHIFGVKINLTVNILFDDYEIQSALDLIRDAYNLGVDSFIIQDVGLANLVHKHYPQVEMHASTQMGIHNLEGVKIAEKLGFKRVVLARETPLSEITRIKQNSKVEIEYFAQGALCVSFSGNCYLSSYTCDASGNRGKCKQLCRLPYTMYDGGKELAKGYLLSTKDFNMLARLKDLEDAGVDVIKIEGRARRPYYVAEATKTYAKAVKGEKYANNLPLAFNRGYTEGYFNGNGDIVGKTQAHIGLEIGEVRFVKKGKKFNEIFINFVREFSPKSTLKFFKDGKEVAVLTAYDLTKQGDEYRITTTQHIEKGWKVNLISDYELEQSTLSTKIKKLVDISILAKENEPICAKMCLNGKKVSVSGDVCLPAQNCPLTDDDFEKCFTKSELYTANLTLNLGNVFLTKQQLNNFRRAVYDEITNVLTQVDHEKLSRVFVEKVNSIKKFEDFEFVEDINQSSNAKNVVLNPEAYKEKDIIDFVNICKKQNKTPYLNLPIFALEQDILFIKQVLKKANIPVVANNLWALTLENEKIIGGGLNVYNNQTANYFGLPYITAEGEDHFQMPYMVMRHCPIKNHIGGDCADCKYKKGITYKAENGKIFELKRQKLSTCTFYLCDKNK